MNNDILVDIVIPLYNEEKVLAASMVTLLDFLKKSAFPYRYVITLANNASTDGSWKICTDLAQKYPAIKALDVGKKGKGLAVRTAWQQSQGDILVFTDTDLSLDLNCLRPLVDAVSVDGYDLAIANRLGKDSKIVAGKNLRKLASRVYNFLVRIVLHSPFADHQCGFKVMKKSSFMKIAPCLIETRFFFDTELVITSLREGFRIRPIDITCNESVGSSVSLFGDSMRMFGNIFRLRRRLLLQEEKTMVAVERRSDLPRDGKVLP